MLPSSLQMMAHITLARSLCRALCPVVCPSVTVSSLHYSTNADKEASSDKKTSVKATKDQPTGVPASSSGGLRSLSEVLGESLSASISAKPDVDGPTDADLDALFGDARPLAKRASRSSAAAAAPEAQEASSSRPAPHAAEGGSGKKGVHAKYGYAVLGGIIPSDEGSSTAASLFQAQPRLHPRRIFVPGQQYEPSDLNAYADATSGARSKQRAVRTMPTSAEVRQHADYKNVAFLEKFINSSGRLLPRRKTKLPMHDHIQVVSQIKIARAMGFLAHETRLEKQHLRRVRDDEARQAHEQGRM